MDLLQLKTAIDTKINEVAGAEKINKARLSELSRDLLTYIIVEGSPDIATVNRLLSVLTPANLKAASQYFEHFLPYQFKDGVFGEAIKKQARKDAKIKAATDFMVDESNDLWIWLKDQGQPEGKEKDYKADIQKAIKAALKGNEAKHYAPLSVADVMNAVVDVEGISLADLFDILGQTAPVADAA
jgi:hypothetical protein